MFFNRIQRFLKFTSKLRGYTRISKWIIIRSPYSTKIPSCHSSLMLQHHHVTILQCYNTTMLQYYNVTILQCYNTLMLKSPYINPLNAELNPICHFSALLGAHHILHVSKIRVKTTPCYNITIVQYFSTLILQYHITILEYSHVIIPWC